MGAGFSVCQCNSAHATSPAKTTLQSLGQPDRTSSSGVGTGGGHSGCPDAFFKVGKSPSVATASPKTSGSKKNGSYKPARVLSHRSPERALRERNSSTLSSAVEKLPFGIHEANTFSIDADLTSSDSALVIDLTEDNTQPRQHSERDEHAEDLPSRAERPKSAASRHQVRRSARRRDSQLETALELEDVERANQDLEDIPPFRRFRPKSARDPRRRSQQVTGSARGQSSYLSRSLSMPSHQKLKLKLKGSDGESSDLSDDVSESPDSGKDEEDEFYSSDTLSIPDETDPTSGAAVTTITVKPKLGQNILSNGRKTKTTDKERAVDKSEVKGGIWERSSHTKSAVNPSIAGKDDNNNSNMKGRNAVSAIYCSSGFNSTEENGSDDCNNNNLFTSSYHGSGYGEERLTRGGISKKTCACTSTRDIMNKENSRASQHAVLTDLEQKANRRRETSCKTIASRPDSGIAGSSSASYASSEAALLDSKQHLSQADLLASSLEMLEHVYQVRAEGHPTVSSLVKAVTVNCHSAQTKAHALYRWLSGQSLVYYKCASCSNPSSPTAKLNQLAVGKITHAALYQEMARCAGLRCEVIEGHVKGVNYYPGSPVVCQATQHAWNAVSLNGHYALLDAQMGSLPHKFFLEHFFMTPPDEFCLSHFPSDKRWLLMTRAISEQDFSGTLKTWPTMFAFNIRPLSMRSVIRTYDGRLSVTVLLRSVAVTPVLEYAGPGVALDGDSLSLGIDQEIRNTDNAETFHMCLPQEGDYFFTLMVHDVEEDEDIPVFQYKIEYSDELL